MIHSVNLYKLGDVFFVERAVRTERGLGRADSYTRLDGPTDPALGEELIKHLRGDEIGQRPRSEMFEDAGCRSMAAFHKRASKVGVAANNFGGYVARYGRRVGAGWLSEVGDPSQELPTLDDAGEVGRIIRDLFRQGAQVQG